jgi:hypothetical protein
MSLTASDLDPPVDMKSPEEVSPNPFENSSLSSRS